MSFAISIVTILFGFIWTIRIRKPQTRRITAFLAFSALLQYDTFIGIAPYSFYVVTFASILAGIEPSNSLHLRPYQKLFFLITSMIFILFALESAFAFPFILSKPLFGIAYLVGASIILLKGHKKVKSRLGIIVIWAGFALNWILA